MLQVVVVDCVRQYSMQPQVSRLVMPDRPGTGLVQDDEIVAYVSVVAA
jgi:hypothetical protein